MKKVRITLKKGKPDWSFTLYDSAESALYLKDDPQYDDNFEEEYKTNLTLREGDIFEIEWIGSEWVYSDDPDRLIEPDRVSDKYEHIRLGKLSSKSRRRDVRAPAARPAHIRLGKLSSKSGVKDKLGYIEIYSGWIVGGTIPWCRSKGLPVNAKEIKSKDESLIDFSELFRDDIDAEEEQERFNPKVSN